MRKTINNYISGDKIQIGKMKKLKLDIFDKCKKKFSKISN